MLENPTCKVKLVLRCRESESTNSSNSSMLRHCKVPKSHSMGAGIGSSYPRETSSAPHRYPLSQHLCLPEQNSFYRASLHVVLMTQWPHQLRGFVGSVLMTGQKALPTEMLGSRKSVRRNKIPLPAKYDVLLQLFGKSSC